MYCVLMKVLFNMCILIGIAIVSLVNKAIFYEENDIKNLFTKQTFKKERRVISLLIRFAPTLAFLLFYLTFAMNKGDQISKIFCKSKLNQ